MNHEPPTKSIEQTIRRLTQQYRNTTNSADLETMSAPAFRAVVANRLRILEAELADVRVRINGLIFVTVGAVIVTVIERLLT